MRPMRIGVARTMGTTWRVVLFNPTHDDPYRIAYTLESGFRSRKLAMVRAGQWRDKWRRRLGVFSLFLSLDRAVDEATNRCAPEKADQ